jgi:hypothetical protein
LRSKARAAEREENSVQPTDGEAPAAGEAKDGR